MNEHTTKCDTETQRNREKFEQKMHPKTPTKMKFANGVASVIEKTFLWNGVDHNRHYDTRNQFHSQA